MFPVDVTGQLSGYVVSLGEQWPLADVRVRVCSDSSSNSTVWTNDDGWFELETVDLPECVLVTSVEGLIEYDLVLDLRQEPAEQMVISIPTELDERLRNARDTDDVNPKDLTTITGELPAGEVQTAGGQTLEVEAMYRRLESGILWLDVDGPGDLLDDLEVVLSPDSQIVVSRFDGRFEIESIEPGTYGLTLIGHDGPVLSTGIRIDAGLNKAVISIE